MKKIIALIMASVIMVGMGLLGYATDITTKADKKDMGLIISAENFNQVFCGEPSTRKLITNFDHDIGESLIEINTISLDGYAIKLDATVIANGTKSHIYAKGQLFDSYKREDGRNVFVAVFDDVEGDYKIKLFEIYNDVNPTSKLLENNSGKGRHLKIYLADEKNNLLLHEITLPKVFKKLNKPRGQYADSINDAFWYLGIAKPIINTEIKATEENIKMLGLDSEINQQANGRFSQHNFGNIKKISYKIGFDDLICYSLPFAKYKHLDVRPQSTWILNFKIAEHTTVNGATYRSISNLFRYKNLELKMAAGGGTTFIKTTRQGKMMDPNKGLRKAGDDIKSYVMQKIIKAIPYAPTIKTVTGWISKAGSLETITLGDKSVSLSGGYTTAVGTKVKSCELYKCTDYDNKNDIGHYYYYQVEAQYEGDGKASDTCGLMRVSFDTFNYMDNSTTHTSEDFELDYIADNH